MIDSSRRWDDGLIDGMPRPAPGRGGRHQPPAEFLRMPGFSGCAALTRVRQRQPELVKYSPLNGPELFRKKDLPSTQTANHLGGGPVFGGPVGVGLNDASGVPE